VSGYDFIILDCPPNLGILTMNALISANKVIIPSTADYFALQGLEQLKPSLDEVRELNPDLSISGILLTMVDNRTTLNGIMTEDIQRTAESMGTKVFDSQIRRSVKIREAQLLQSDIFAESKNASVTDDYNNFINEFLRMED
jgi:chromosome partitioning protein